MDPFPENLSRGNSRGYKGIGQARVFTMTSGAPILSAIVRDPRVDCLRLNVLLPLPLYKKKMLIPVSTGIRHTRTRCPSSVETHPTAAQR